MRRAYRTAGRVCGVGGGARLGALLNKFILNWWNNLKADGGTVQSVSEVNSYSNMAKANGIYDSIQFGMLGAYNIRTSGNTKYVIKAYSMDVTPNDATQTTESLQPYLSGFIAPNEKWGLKNPNGDNRFIAHPEISFDANMDFSISIVFNFYYGINNAFVAQRIYNGTNTILHLIDDGAGARKIRPRLLTLGSLESTYPSQVTPEIIGNNTILTWSRSSGIIKLYINNVEIPLNSVSHQRAVEFSVLNSSSYSSNSHIYCSVIRNQALTPTQIEAEHNWFKNNGYLGYEGSGIPAVKIGDQVWQTSNCEMVATPMGNVIQEMQADAAVEKVSGGGFEGGLIGSILRGEKQAHGHLTQPIQ